MGSRGVNKVILVGNLGDDPSVRYMPNGNAVANLSLATSESWIDQQGQEQSRTEWHRLTMYRKLAEIAGEYLKKGSQIYVEGKLQTRKWQDQQGQDRYTTEIIVDHMQMLGGRDGNQNNQQGGYQQQGNNQGGNTQHYQQGNNQSRGYGNQGQQGYQQNNQQAQGARGGNQQRQNTQQQTPPMAEPDFDFDDDIPFAPLFKQHRSMNYAC